MTAKEYIRENFGEYTSIIGVSQDDCEEHCSMVELEELLINFAKMYVVQALKHGSENAILCIDGIREKSNGNTYIVDEGNHYSETVINIDKESILNSYPLDNIV